MSDFPLETGLFDVEDLMERSMTPFFLLGDTAESVSNGQITGECVEVGIKETDYTESLRSMLKTFDFRDLVDENTPKEHIISYTANGVKVKIHVIRKHYKFLENPNTIFYKYGQYCVPNPLESYLKTKTLVK